MARQRVVTLVPWRDAGEFDRTWAWDITKPILEAMPWPLFTGEPRGEAWSRSQAVNVASEAAGKWNVAIVGDADTIPDQQSLERAITWVTHTRGGVRPHLIRWDLNEAATLNLAQGWDPREIPIVKHMVVQNKKPQRAAQAGGGMLVIHRDAWEKVRGFDESYIEWGYEDTAMMLALARNARFDRIPGEAWHLWHEPTGWKGQMRAAAPKFEALKKEYAEEIWRAEQEHRAWH